MISIYLFELELKIKIFFFRISDEDPNMEKPEKPSVRFLVPDSANSSTTETVTNVVVSTTITKSPRSSPRKRPAVLSLVSQFSNLFQFK